MTLRTWLIASGSIAHRSGRIRSCALALGSLALLLNAAAAGAQCLPDPANPGDTVSCSGTITNAYTVPIGINSVTVVVQAGATMTTFADSITVNDTSAVTNNGAITVNGAGSTAINAGSGASSAAQALFVNSATGDIQLQGAQAAGFRVGQYSRVENHGRIHGQGGNQLGVQAGSDGHVINNGTIDLGGADSAGIIAADQTRVENRGSINLGGDGSIAVQGGNGTLNSFATFDNGSTGVITLSGDNAFGISVGDYTAVDNDGSIVVAGANGVAIAVGDNMSTVQNRGSIQLDGDGARGLIGMGTSILHNQAGGAIVQTTAATGVVAIDAGDGGEASNYGSLSLTGTNSIGIRGGDNARVNNFASLDVSGDTSTGMLAGSNGAQVINQVDGVIDMSGAGAQGLVVGATGRIEQRGSLTLRGDGARGLVGADGTGQSQKTSVENFADASILMEGANSYGVSAGNFASATNQGTITINGANSFGIQAGNDSDASNNSSGQILLQAAGGVGMSVADNSKADNHGLIDVVGAGGTAIQSGLNSNVTNDGTIQVGGLDSVGIRAGGYAAGSQPAGDVAFTNTTNSASGVAGRIYSVDPDAGALIILGESINGESRVWNSEGASIQADVTNITLAGRGVAVEGSVGVDAVRNDGLIEGRILLRDQDDLYIQTTSGQLVYSVDGSLDGGADTGPNGDVIELKAGSASTGQFLLDSVQNFETLRVIGGSWQVEGASQTAMNAEVNPGASLLLVNPLTIGGNYDHVTPAMGEPVAVVQARLSRSAQTAALLHVDGDASLDEGRLQIDVGGGIIGNQTFTIVETDGSITEQFDEISFSGSPGVIFGTPQYLNGNQLQISVQIAGYSQNQTITSAYADRVNASSPPSGLQTILNDINSLSYLEYRQAMDLLHPEAYDAHASATLDLANRYTELMMQRPRYCIPNATGDNIDPRTKLPCRMRRLEPWFTVYGQFRDREGEMGHTSYTDSAGGLVFGIDRRLNQNFLVTGTIGTAYDVIRVDQVGKGRLTTLDVGLYGGYTNGPLRVQGAVSYGHGWNSQFRNIHFTGFARTASSEYSIDRFGARLRGEYGFDVFGIGVAPVASLDYTALVRSGFNETGAESLSLVVDGRTDNVVTVRAGLDIGAAYQKDQYWNDAFEYADGTWRPNLSVAWRQVVSGADREITARFIGADPASGRFTVFADDAKQGFEVGAGVDFTPAMANRLTLGLRYDAFVWTGITSHELMLRMRYSF